MVESAPSNVTNGTSMEDDFVTGIRLTNGNNAIVESRVNISNL